MSVRYDVPNRAARWTNTVFRSLAQVGISIAGTRAIRVRGRTSGVPRDVVVNVLALDGREYLVSPRGNTQWARNASAAGQIEMGPRWRRTVAGLREVADEAKADVLKRYLDRWYWEVKGHVGGLTPASTAEELAAAAPGIPVFELTPQPAGSSPGLPNSAAVTCMTSSRAWRLAASQDTAAGN